MRLFHGCLQRFGWLAASACICHCVGCGAPSSGAGQRHFVDVSDGRMITAHTIGREPIILRDRSGIPDPPALPQKRTLAAVNQPGATALDQDGTADAASAPGGPLAASVGAGREGSGAPREVRSQRVSPPAATPLPELDASSFRDPPQTQPGVAAGAVWAILIRSVTVEEGINHRSLAAAAAAAAQTATPDLRGGLWVHSTEKGSMLLYGRYPALGDEQAQSDLKWLKSFEAAGQKPYAGAHMARVQLGAEAPASSLHPYDLRAVRKEHNSSQPLYTISVAVWIVEDQNDQRGWAAMKAAAEAYTRQLRALGHEAYFHHNDLSGMSDVTVGRFGAEAINATSGFLSPDVMRIYDAFPHRLVNGEQVIDPDTRKPQEPILVDVPK